MYKEYNGREWSSEEKYLEYKANSCKILNSSLAIESYQDFTGDEDSEISQAYKKLGLYYKNKPVMTEEELLKTSYELVKIFDAIFDKIGREKFIFYDDGDVNYKWGK